MIDHQKKKAELFLRLHLGPDILVLPNAWDMATARVFEHAGFKAIGMTSSAIAASLGYLDGEQAPFSEMLKVIERIATGTNLPVNADIEAGYGKDIPEVVGNVRRVMQAGVAGINLEDGTGDPQRPLADTGFQVEKLKAVREAVAATGGSLVINARTDTYMVPFPDPVLQFQETVKRANAYRQAGADCIFIPGRLDRPLIARLNAEVDAPLNIFASPITPNARELQAMGVARLSIGPGAFRAALARVGKIATELAVHGTYESLFAETLSKADVDNLLKPFVRG